MVILNDAIAETDEVLLVQAKVASTDISGLTLNQSLIKIMIEDDDSYKVIARCMYLYEVACIHFLSYCCTHVAYNLLLNRFDLAIIDVNVEVTYMHGFSW